MRHLRRVLILVLAGLATATGLRAQSPSAQGTTTPAAPELLPIPANVTADGLPPIPASIVQDLAPYASSRRAVLLGWHPTRREILIATAFGDAYQVHSVAGPAMDRQQLTFFPRGVPVPGTPPPDSGAWYATDGASRNGMPVWSHRGGLIAFESTRRGGHGGADRDLWVMNPRDPSSARLVSEVAGRWSVADWSPDDTELLAVNLPAENTQTSLWRVNVQSGKRTELSPPGDPAVWRTPTYSPDGRFVYVLSNHHSDTLRLWRGEIATGE